jgi:hypothetical protein
MSYVKATSLYDERSEVVPAALLKLDLCRFWLSKLFSSQAVRAVLLFELFRNL